MNLNLRNHCTVLRLDDDALGHTGCFIGFTVEGNTIDNVLKFKRTGIFADDDTIEWVPLSDCVVLLDEVAITEVQYTTIRNVKSRQDNVGLWIAETDLGQVADNHLALLVVIIGERYGTELIELQLCVVLRND